MNNKGTLQLAGCFPDELGGWLQQMGFPAFRGEQVFHWLQRHAAVEFTEMANLPQDLISFLQREFQAPLPLRLAASRLSEDGTEKYLFLLPDEAAVETVLIPENDRQTVCVSVQVGCAMKCSFCATGRAGFVRNLTAGEITAQALWVQNRLGAAGTEISNVVYMGMGEPLANYRAVLKSLRLLNDSRGMNLGARRITVSTCGLAPEIKLLAREGLQVNLAVSLHAADDALRSEIMPINRRYPLAELLTAVDYYIQTTGRRVSFEYALIEDFNDSPRQARQLRDLLGERLCHVNLIPINPVGKLRSPGKDRIRAFAQILADAGLPVSIRKERGGDIEAACGQLRDIGK